MGDLAEKAAGKAVERQQGNRPPSMTTLLNQRWLAEELQRQLGGPIEEAQSFVRTVLNAVKAAPDLAKCTPDSIYGGMFAAAQLNLQIGGGLKQAYLIPRRDRNSPTGWSASFQLGYPGIIKLAANSGMIVGVDTVRVMKGDRFRQGASSERGKFFDVAFGDNHDSTDPNDVEGVIGMVYQRGRKEPRWVYLSRRQIEARRPDATKEQQGQNGPYIPNTPWKTDWAAMAEKTAVIEALKFAPKSAQLELATTYDDTTVESSQSSNGDVTVTRPEEGSRPETITAGTPTGGAAQPTQQQPAPQQRPAQQQPPQRQPEPPAPSSDEPPFPEESPFDPDADYDAPPEDFWTKSGPEL